LKHSERQTKQNKTKQTPAFWRTATANKTKQTPAFWRTATANKTLRARQHLQIGIDFVTQFDKM